MRKITPRAATRGDSKINARAQVMPGINNTIHKILANLKLAVTVVAYILILKIAQQKAKNVIHAKRSFIFPKYADQAVSQSQRETEFTLSATHQEMTLTIFLP